MAKRVEQVSTTKQSKLAKNIANITSTIYKNTFFSTDDNKRVVDRAMNNIDNTIGDILRNNENNTGQPTITSLINRVNDSIKGEDISKQVEKIFGDQESLDSIMGLYQDNTYIKDMEEEIDQICKYMPQLEDALSVKRDNVLSADSITKDFLYASDLSEADPEGFSDDFSDLKEKYNLLDTVEHIYEETQKYGECFYYVIDYNEAFNMLNGTKSDTLFGAETDFKLENGVFTEAANPNSEKAVIYNHAERMAGELPNINLKLDTRTYLVETVKNTVRAQSISDRVKDNASLLLPNKEELEAQEALFSTKSSSKGKDNTKLNLNGCIVKELKRTNIIPIYMEDKCMGYYYVEANYELFTKASTRNSMPDPVSVLGGTRGKAGNTDENILDKMIKSVANKISRTIDNKFINANQDLQQEIYMMLKYNKEYRDGKKLELKVQFLPVDNVFHFKFKTNPRTHRGISDLNNALLPAKMYSSIYTTNVIANLTRGMDKRVYYVKQSVDTNIAQTLLNTVNTIKKSNFGLREITNLKTIMNITGKFNDYIIPLGPSGDYPIQFEIMPGQDFPVKTELLDLLESQAINGVEVPVEIIQTRNQVDYAMRLTMTNIRFLTHILKRQSKYQYQLSPFIAKIFNCEYGTSKEIKVKLPVPAMQRLTNNAQLIQSTAENINNISTALYGENTEESPVTQLEKNLFFKKQFKRNLETIINFDEIEEDMESARREAAAMLKTINKQDTGQDDMNNDQQY